MQKADLDLARQSFEFFSQLVVEAGFRAPFSLCEEHVGAVIDAVGLEVCVVDANREMPDDRARDIAALIVLAVNEAAGSA